MVNSDKDGLVLGVVSPDRKTAVSMLRGDSSVNEITGALKPWGLSVE
jgi:hypothetical protein